MTVLVQAQRLLDRLDPQREPGRLSLITRMGASRVTEALPALIERALRLGMDMGLVRPCDPSLVAWCALGSVKEVVDRGKLVVGTGSTNPPWHYEDANGQLVGFDVDVMDLVAKKLGATQEIVDIDAALAEKVEPVALHFLDRDNDGHWYVVQESKRQEWEKWLQIPSDDQASWDAPDFAKPVGGAPNTVSFYTAAPASQWRRVGDWQPIETAPKGKTVLVHYKNQLGNGRTMRGCYYPPETLESDTEESGWADEGWYEQSEAYEYLMPLDGDPTHWMPLPALPEDK